MDKAVSSTDASKRHQFVGMASVLLTKSAIMVFVRMLQTTTKITIQTSIQITIQIVTKIIRTRVGGTIRNTMSDTATRTSDATMVSNVSTTNALITTKRE